MVICTRPEQDWAHQYFIMEGQVPWASPTQEGVLATDGCWGRTIIFFWGTATNMWSLLHQITSHPHSGHIELCEPPRKRRPEMKRGTVEFKCEREREEWGRGEQGENYWNPSHKCMKLSNNKMNRKEDMVLASEFICQMCRFYHINEEEGTGLTWSLQFTGLMDM